jgi:hypothetical protein
MMTTTRQARISTGVLALTAALTLAFSSDVSADPGSFSAGGAGTSGTLPLTTGTGVSGLPLPPFFAPYGPALRKAAKPAASLTGLADELDDIIAAAYSPDGSGWFHLSPVAVNGSTTITYYGNVILELDRQAFLSSQASANLAVAPQFNGGVLTVQVEGMGRTAQVLRTGQQSLHLQRMIRNELVGNGISVRTFNKKRNRSAKLRIEGQGGLIRIEQSQ